MVKISAVENSKYNTNMYPPALLNATRMRCPFYMYVQEQQMLAGYPMDPNTKDAGYPMDPNTKQHATPAQCWPCT